jgi:hypothetical protein
MMKYDGCSVSFGLEIGIGRHLMDWNPAPEMNLRRGTPDGADFLL